VTISAPVLDETADTSRCAECSHLPGCPCPHFCRPEPTAPSLYLVTTPGLPDALLDPAALAASLASGARPGGLYDVSAPGRKVPLVLCLRYPGPGVATVCLPGVAGESDPVVVAELKISSEGEGR
jgi:hypothetical protein